VPVSTNTIRPARIIWVVSLPLILVQIGETVVRGTDTVFLGHVGTVELAALALADTILEFSTVILVGIEEAMIIVIARRVGEGRESVVGTVFNRGLLLMAIAGAALCVVLEVVLPSLVEHLGATHDVAMAARVYLRVAAVGVVFESVTRACGSLYVALSRTAVLVRASAVLVVTNLVLGYGLIFGRFGAPRLGIRGAALAAVAAEVATAIFLAVHTFTRLDAGRYGLRRFGGRDRQVTRSLLTVGSPAALGHLVVGAGWLLFFMMLARLGTEALASSNVVYACFEILLIPALAFGEATFSLVGNLSGQGRHVGSLMRQLVRAAFAVTLPAVAFTLILPKTVLSIFTADPAAMASAAGPLRVVALGMLAVIPAELWVAAVGGLGATDTAFAITTLATVVTVAWVYVGAFVFHLALTLVWLSVPTAWLIGLGLSVRYVRKAPHRAGTSDAWRAKGGTCGGDEQPWG